MKKIEVTAQSSKSERCLMYVKERAYCLWALPACVQIKNHIQSVITLNEEEN